VNIDRRVAILSLARAVETFSISFLIVVLPLFIASDRIHTDGLTAQEIVGMPITDELLIGLALSAAILISSMGQPVAGRVTDILHKRKIFMVIGLSLLAVSTPFYLVVESYTGILVIRIIQGIAGAFAIPAAVALINEYSIPNNNRGENFGIYNTFRMVGLGLGPIIAGVIVTEGPYAILGYTIPGIDAAFYFTVVFVVVALALVLLFIEDPPHTIGSDSSSKTIRDIIRTPEFELVLVFSFATFWLAASINVFSTLEVQVNERFNQTATWFGIQFAAAILANVIGQIPIGRASDVYRKRPFILAGFLLLIPSITLQGFVLTTLQMTGLRALQGISVALVFIPTLAYVGELAGSEQGGLYLSVVTSSFAFGLAIGPIAAGVLFTIGGFSLPFVVAGVCSLVGLCLVGILLPKDA